MGTFSLAALDAESWQLIFTGLLVTLKLAAASLALSIVIGVIVGLAGWSRLKVIRPIAGFYVEVARNTPPLVQILFWYFSASVLLPEWAFMRIRTAGFEFSAAVIALSLYHGAFIGEVLRAGLNAIHSGQYQAARAIGLSFSQMMRHVIGPQVVRVTTPPMINEFVSLLKNTSLALAVGVTELTYQYKYIENFKFRGVEALLVVTFIYLVLCFGISLIGRTLGERMDRTGGSAGRRAGVY